MNINRFYIAGINYKKTDATVRGKFAINSSQYSAILEKASAYRLSELFVLSTCNRTEIYGCAENVTELISVLCSGTQGTVAEFLKISYVKNGWEAVQHLYAVSSGLDSQILGDYEIIGQIKKAVKFSKQKGFIGTFLERLTNSVLETSKVIKSQTLLSSGTVSVSFAAIRYLKENVASVSTKKIVLIGTGKIGTNTCRNLQHYLHCRHVTLINRTDTSAKQLADELGYQYSIFTDSHDHINTADVIIVATGADIPLLKKSDLPGCTPKLIIDLSVPYNVDPAVTELAQVRLVNIDELSKVNDETLQTRVTEVPKARKIIEEKLLEFQTWFSSRSHAPALKAVKQKLLSMQDCSLFMQCKPSYTSTAQASVVQKAVNTMALKMKQQQLPGCCYIEAINEFISASRN